MSQTANGIFGALAIALTFGAVQFASGHDLAGRQQVVSTAPTINIDINRTAKADRAALKAAPVPAETIALRHNGLADTSVLVRVPRVKDEARNRPMAPVKPSPSKKMTVACEPPVSVLTEVAKLLQPGRCIT
jgi:hypothetical protein